MGKRVCKEESFAKRFLSGCFAILLLTFAACGSDEKKEDASSVPTTDLQETSITTEDTASATISQCSMVEEVSTVHFLPTWQVGDKRKLEVTVEKQSSGVSNDAVVTNFILEVEEVTAEKIGFALTAEQALLNGELFEGGFSFQDLLYSLDADRVISGVENISDIQTQLVEILGETNEFWDLLDEEALGVLLTQDLELYHHFENVELTVGETLEVTEDIPHPFGGFVIPMISQYEITQLVDDDGCIEVEMKTEIADRELFVNSMVEVMRETAELNGTEHSESDIAELEEMFQTMNLDRNIVGQYDAGTKSFKKIIATEVTSVIESGKTESEEEIKTILDLTPNR